MLDIVTKANVFVTSLFPVHEKHINKKARSNNFPKQKQIIQLVLKTNGFSSNKVVLGLSVLQVWSQGNGVMFARNTIKQLRTGKQETKNGAQNQPIIYR